MPELNVERGVGGAEIGDESGLLGSPSDSFGETNAPLSSLSILQV